jgi:hypothetical protein
VSSFEHVNFAINGKYFRKDYDNPNYYASLLIFQTYKNTIIIKGATQMSGHSLKLHFCMFERSQGKHNNLDCHKCFWNIFHQLQSLHVQNLTQIKNGFAC